MNLFRAKAGLLLIAVPPLLLSRYSFASPSFTSGISTGTIQNSSVIEASGIVASRMNANVLWTHNDSGNPARIFPMTSAGTNLGTYSISGATNIDWEDIAVGPGPAAGVQYLYIGDIGDNGAIRSSVSIYRVPEPVVSDTQSPASVSVSGAVKFNFTYPGGARDAESLFVDPLTSDIYIISKRENPHHLYRAAYSQQNDSYAALAQMTMFTDSYWLTGADISPNGNEIIVRGSETASGIMFLRPPGGSITDAFNTTPISIPLHAEGQGEAIGFDPNGRGYYTTSEGSGQPIYYFDLVPPPAGNVYWDHDGTAAGTYIATGAGMGGSGTWNTALKWYNGSSDVAWVGGNNAVFWGTAGTVTLAATQSVNSLTFKTNGYTLTASTLTLAGSSVTVDAGVTATISSTVAGSAGLVKNGSGILNLAHSNSYTDGTTIAGGTLMVINTSGSGTGTGPVTVNSGAILGGSGTIQGNVINNGTLAPGSSAGTLHLGGSYTQSSGGKLEIELGSTASHDLLAVSGSATLAGILAVSLISGFTPQEGDVFEIISSSGFGGSTFTSTSLPDLSGNLIWNVNYGGNSVALSVILPGDFNGNGTVDAADYAVWRKGLGTIYQPDDYNTWRAHFGQTASAPAASLAAVPEPAAWLLLSAGIAILAQRNSARKGIA